MHKLVVKLGIFPYNESRNNTDGRKESYYMSNEAILSNEKNFTIFKYGGRTIRFRAPYSLDRYTKVKEWNHGYLVVMAKYLHNPVDEEEYIDLMPILDDLYVDTKEFLSPIKKVRIQYD